MTKKAKKRIKELCGLESLSREDRIARCKELLDDDDFKQEICHKMLGTTFRDINKILKEEIASSKARSEEEAILEEMANEQPEKLDPELQPLRRQHKAIRRGYYTREESLTLIEADSGAKWLAEATKPRDPPTHTWSPEEIWALINCCYDSRNFPH